MAKSLRIDPLEIHGSSSPLGKAKAAGSGEVFSDVMSVAGAFAPLAGELTYQTTGNSNAAAVLHSAFSTMPVAFGGRGAGGGGLGGLMSNDSGIMGANAYGAGYGMDPGVDPNGAVPGTGSTQAQLLDQMNTNNLELLSLQAMMQNNMQQWTTKSNILKASHDAKMAMIQHFAPRG